MLVDVVLFIDEVSCFMKGLVVMLLSTRSPIIVVVSLLMTAPFASAAESVVVGAATVDVTPDYPIRLNGFGGRRAESEGVTQRIYAKALAIGSDEQGPALLVTLDSLGVPNHLTEAVWSELFAKYGIPRDRFVITFSHSHTTPMLRGASPTIFSTPIPPAHQKHIDQYTAEMHDWLVKVCEKALADRKPAKLEWSKGTVKFAANRRGREIAPVDHDLPMMVVRDPKTNRPFAIWVSYACHCVTLSHNKIAGDWAGYAQEHIEKEHQGVTAMVSIGGGADQNPNSGVRGADVSTASAQGKEILDEVNRLLGGALKPVDGHIHSRFDRIDLPLHGAPTTREDWEAQAKQGGPSGYLAQVQLQRLDRGEQVRTSIDYPIQSWAFGDDLAIVFMAGEVVCDYPLRLKAEFDADRFWFNGYSNYFCSYIPSERILKEGGYEGGDANVYFDVPGKFKPGLEQKIIDVIHEQIPDAFEPLKDAAGTMNTRSLPPNDAVKAIKTKPGMRVDLVASEPLVIDPVSIDWGPDGRLWVCEMHDYPQGVDGDFKPGGRVVYLEDTNADGKYDKRTVFIEGLPFPTGVSAWREGVLICSAPDVIYAEDTTGDGKADVSRVILTGFATHNYQARVNSLRWGLDNWMYAASGLFGGKVKNAKGEEFDISGQDFRFNPDTGAVQAATGVSQQGRVRNDWGDWFGCNNGSLGFHFPLADHYIARNPHVAPPTPEMYIAMSAQLFGPDNLTLFKLSGGPGVTTSGCGIGIYRDGLLGEGFYGNTFTCEPVNQLVHREIVDPYQSGLRGRRADDEQESEFLISTEPWFRPVQARTGPDGGLYVVDMHRFVIEHPIWIPEETRKHLNTRAGDDRGRIYRVVLVDFHPEKAMNYGEMDNADLAAALDSSNGTTRDLIHQMLIWRQAKDAVPLLKRIARESLHAAARAQALCVLDGLDQLAPKDILPALSDENAGVRRQAIRLCEGRLDDKHLLAAILKLVDDENGKIRLQLACTLGETDDPRAGRVLAGMLMSNANDAYLRGAVMSSAVPHISTMLASLEGKDVEPVLKNALMTVAVASNDGSAVLDRLAKLPRGDDKHLHTRALSEANVLLDALRSQGRNVHQIMARADTDSPVHQTWLDLLGLARKVIADSQANLKMKIAAIQVISHQERPANADLQLIGSQTEPTLPPDLQQAAIAAITRFDRPQVPDLLLKDWPARSPAIRTAIIDALLKRDVWTVALLDSPLVSDRQIRFDATRRQALLQHENHSIRTKAQELFGQMNAERQQVVSAYMQSVNEDGNATAGAAVFNRACAQCHQLGGLGKSIGADLPGLTDKSKENLLIGILDPNRAVLDQYIQYTVETSDLQQLVGLIAAESSVSVTLKTAEGEAIEILRTNIESMTSNGQSLMPVGLEADITPAEMTNLIAFVQNATPPKDIAGNHPQNVTPDHSGTIVLAARKAAIFGDSITYEQGFRQNVGYWHGQNDHATWSVDVIQPSAFDVYLDYACADGADGDAFAVTIHGQTIIGTTKSTGDWRNFRPVRIGEITLETGRYHTVIRPDGAINKSLFDLRAAVLVPKGQVPKWDAIAAVIEGKMVSSDQTKTIEDVAAAILDGRNELIDKHAEAAAAIIAAMTHDMSADQEYARIPAIWRVAIAAGKRNDSDQLRDVLKVSLPKNEQPLRDWQSVVIGGGVINGISQLNVWPADRIAEIIGQDKALGSQWERAIDLAFTMADDEAVPTGTRYDALRMVAMRPWEHSGPSLVKYLPKDANGELQMGAVSGLADVNHAEATKALIANFGNLTDHNKSLAVTGLLRSSDRRAAVRAAMKTKAFPAEALNDQQHEQLKVD